MSTEFDPLKPNGSSPFGVNTQPIVHPQSPRDQTKILVKGSELNRESLSKIAPIGNPFRISTPFANSYPHSISSPKPFEPSETMSPVQAVDKLLSAPAKIGDRVKESPDLTGMAEESGTTLVNNGLSDTYTVKNADPLTGIDSIEPIDSLLDSDGPLEVPEDPMLSGLDSLDVISPAQSDDEDDNMTLPTFDELSPIARIPISENAMDVQSEEPVITRAPDNFKVPDVEEIKVPDVEEIKVPDVEEIKVPDTESAPSQVDLVNKALKDAMSSGAKNKAKALRRAMSSKATTNDTVVKESEDKANEIPDYSAMTPEERAISRHELAIKLGILRKAYPEYAIPAITEEQSVESVHDTYEKWLRHIDADNSANSYKMYLVLFWLGMELVGTKVLHVNMSGFTLNQLSIMNRYQTLLVELGERSFGGIGSDWPPEVRILLLSIVNAVVFIVFKYVSSFMGPEVASAVQSAINGIMSSEGSSKGNDMASMIANFGSMFTGGQGNTSKPKAKKRASRRPRYMD